MNTANAFKLTQKVVAILSCFIVFMTSYPFYADATHASEGHAPIQQFASNVNFSKNFIVEWKVDHDSQSVEFILNVAIDDKGWVLLGFLPASNDSYKTAQEDGLQGTNGDFVVTWFSSPGRTKTLVRNLSLIIKIVVIAMIDNAITTSFKYLYLPSSVAYRSCLFVYCTNIFMVIISGSSLKKKKYTSMETTCKLRYEI